MLFRNNNNDNNKNYFERIIANQQKQDAKLTTITLFSGAAVIGGAVYGAFKLFKKYEDKVDAAVEAIKNKVAETKEKISLPKEISAASFDDSCLFKDATKDCSTCTETCECRDCYEDCSVCPTLNECFDNFDVVEEVSDESDGPERNADENK